MKEHEIIGFLRKALPVRDKSVLVGIGDDAAVVAASGKDLLIFTTDSVVENVHFTRPPATAYQVGWKALGVNISDIAAMGALPRYALVSLGLPDGDRLLVSGLYRGMRALARRFNISIIGGNITRSRDLFLDIFLVGAAARKSLKLRSTARPGDLICVTGTLGGSRRKKHLSFLPRVREVQALLRTVPVSAMMDISDGLASDLPRLAEASRVGFRIFADRIPVSRDALRASAGRAEAIGHALNDGEDYEILFTVPARYRKRVPGAAAGVAVTIVGEITRNRQYKFVVGDKEEKFRPRGFDHFRR